MSETPPRSAPDIFSVEFEFQPGHLGVSVLVLARDRIEALRKAWRLFPEYKRIATGGHVHEVDYAEVDWNSGRCIVSTRPVRIRIRPPKLSDKTVGSEGKHEGEEEA